MQTRAELVAALEELDLTDALRAAKEARRADPDDPVLKEHHHAAVAAVQAARAVVRVDRPAGAVVGGDAVAVSS